MDINLLYLTTVVFIIAEPWTEESLVMYIPLFNLDISRVLLFKPALTLQVSANMVRPFKSKTSMFILSSILLLKGQGSTGYICNRCI